MVGGGVGEGRGLERAASNVLSTVYSRAKTFYTSGLPGSSFTHKLRIHSLVCHSERAS